MCFEVEVRRQKAAKQCKECDIKKREVRAWKVNIYMLLMRPKVAKPTACSCYNKGPYTTA